MYFVYIARCSDMTLYTGYTTNLQEREEKHNKGDGAKYTRHRTPISIVYHEQFESQSDALKREAEIKKLKRKEKEQLIDDAPL